MLTRRLRHRLAFVFILVMEAVSQPNYAAAENSAGKSGQHIAPDSTVLPGYEEVGQRLSAFIECELKDKDIPSLAISLVDGDKMVFAKGYGAASADGKTPATANSMYRVGSVSKLFTDICVMQLVAEGKLDLDADIRKYLPDFTPKNPYDVPITLRRLMCHQAGLVRESPVGHYFDDTSPSLAATIASVNPTTLVYKPGTHTKYSNVGVSVAGYVVEKLTSEPFETHVHKTVLEPLGMPESAFRTNDAIERDRAVGWMRSHHAPRFVAPNFALGTLPAGNLYSSMNELSHLLIAMFNDGQYNGHRVVDHKTLDAMLKPNIGADDKVHEYGIGFRLGELDGHRTFGHGGAVYGYATKLTGLPDAKVGVAASAAIDGGSGSMKRITEYALRLLLAKKEGRPLPEIEETKPVPHEVAKQLVGTYTSGDKFVHIVEEGGDCYLFGPELLQRLRANGKRGFIIDDLMAYGPELEHSKDGHLQYQGQTWSKQNEHTPDPGPARFKNFIGEYGWDHNVLYIFEDRNQLWALIEWFHFYPLKEVGPNVFAFPEEGLYHGEQIVFAENGDHPSPYATAASVRFNRRPLGPEEGKTFQIKPQKSADELYKAAIAATPPKETNRPRAFDLVELAVLDPTIKLDIRYATTNNFMGTVFYKQPRAFMQRPAAAALVRVHKKLEAKGFGLMIFDAYRPWYVTKMFWDGTIGNQHEFVADPAGGSKHNRGCAVDLTLYDLKTNQPVSMVGGYDEMTPRSFPFYPGGTSEQRWHRTVLRKAMEDEGFTVYPEEWWHFDYKDWEQYPIGNVRFEDIATKK